MASYPVPIAGEGAQAAYHVVPDRVQGGWNVYATNRPQEPQQHFETQKLALTFVEALCAQEGVGYALETNEAPAQGRP